MILVEMIFFLQFLDGLLQGSIDRHAFRGAADKVFVFLFAGGVDAAAARSLAGIAQCPQNLAGRVLEIFRIDDIGDVDRDEG